MKESHFRKIQLPPFPFLNEAHHVIALVGGGGKTTLMYNLAEAYCHQGLRVLVTTTTHILAPPDEYFVQSLQEAETLWQAGRYAVAGRPVMEESEKAGEKENKKEIKVAVLKNTDAQEKMPLSDKTAADREAVLPEKPVILSQSNEEVSEVPVRKLRALDDAQLRQYMKAADIVLVEADGAKCLPCKVPASHEPVLPDACDIVIGVAGLDSVGHPMQEVCFRPEQAETLLQKDRTQLLTAEDLAKILASEDGARKNVGSRDYYVVLNKCNDPARLAAAQRIKEYLYALEVFTT
jgi:probable selenium-dependent hydroxylase accessory protein YqeC